MGLAPSAIPKPASPDVVTATVLVDGKPLPGTVGILSIVVNREVNRIPSATLTVRDGEAALQTFKVSNEAFFVPGNKIEIKLGYSSNEETVFKGIIVKHSIKIRSNSSMLTVECRDEAAKMTAGRKSRYYTDKKDSDIIEEIVGMYGLKKDVKATKPDLKEVVQYDSTDWDFIVCRAEANGLLVMAEDGKIIVDAPDAKQQPVLGVSFGATIIELDAEIDARLQNPGVKAMSWSGADQEVTEAEASDSSGKGSGNLAPTDLANVLGGDTSDLRHSGNLSQPELQAWADGLMLRERLAKVRGRVKFEGFADVMPGNVLELQGIGERFEGQVFVSGVRHQYAGGSWDTDVQLGLNPELFVQTFNLRPLPAAGLLPAVSGLQMGVVTALEGDPDGEDRIKVRLPLVSPQEEGAWARLATLDAGQERGTYFRPEIDDEVVVGFLNDDPRHPVVLGMCHSSAKPAPEPGSDDNHLKGYVSREKMKFTFDDEKKIVTIETPGGNKLTLSDEDKGIILEDQNGNKITLDDKGITIESAKDIILKATKDLKAEGMNLELKAQTAFKAEGSGTAELSGANTTVKGSAATVIQGGIVQIN
jgi:Rhs element Vgr protein